MKDASILDWSCYPSRTPSDLRIFGSPTDAVGACSVTVDAAANLYNDRKTMFSSIRIVGRGRVGTAFAARLAQRGHHVADDGALVLLCVPDSAIADVARGLMPGPWVAHTSGATPLAALAPHVKRFGLHPLQSIVSGRGPEQLDGAWAAVTGENDEAVSRATWLAGELGLKPFPIDEGMRALYHAGAAIASNYLVTLHHAASELFRRAGAPPDALLPLMQRVIDNRFELTGPIARGDWRTVEAHLDAIRRYAPELEPLYVALARQTGYVAGQQSPSALERR